MCYHDFFKEKNKSFMKILKRRGPMIDPCGTPVLISQHELKDEPVFVLCFRLVRKSNNNRRLPFSMP